MARVAFAGRWILAMSIVMILLALVIWTIRPSPFNEWMGSAEADQLRTPLSILREWVSGGLAPMTPSGFMTLFPIADLLSLLALLAALGILLVLLAGQWRRNQRTGSWLTRSIPLSRLMRIGVRVRTAMVLIAILGVYLGFEIVSWRNWLLRERYLGQAHRFGESEAVWRDSRHNAEVRLARLDEATSLGPEEDSWTPAARAAVRAYNHDLWRYQLDHASRQLAFYAELRRRYERAATELSPQMPPDPSSRPAKTGSRSLQGLVHDGRGTIRTRSRRLRRADPALPQPSLASPTTRLDPGDLPRCKAPQRQARRRGVHASGRADQLEVCGRPHGARRRLRRGRRFRQCRALATTKPGGGATPIQPYRRRKPDSPPTNGGVMVVPAVVKDRLALYKAGKPFRIVDTRGR